MGKLIKKSLEQVKETLNSVDTFEIYTYISSKLKQVNISESDARVILDVISNKLNVHISQPIKEANEWLDAIIADDGKS